MGRGRVPSEKTTRLDTSAGGRRPCPPRRNPAVGPGADGLGVPPETGHRRETEPHHQTQNQPAGHPHRRPGDQPAGRPRRRPSVRRDGIPPADPGQPAGRPRRRPSVRRDGIPPADPGQPAGRPRRRPGIGQDRVPPPAPGPTGWVPPPEAVSAETKPRRRTRNRRPAGRPPPEARHRPGRSPAASSGTNRLGVPAGGRVRRDGTPPPDPEPTTGWATPAEGQAPSQDGIPPPDPGPTGWVSSAGGLRCCGWASCARWGASDTARHAWRSVPIRAGNAAPQALLPSSRRSAATAESGGAEPTSPTRSVPRQAGGAQTHRDPQAVRRAGPQRRTAQASASVTRPSAR
ncbi:hypothetical protein SAMN05442782_3206 [Streptomyces sp. OK228]|nr:hypothetical protein SAMN05442782_3206 [Streptomyces sp. OK228]